MKHLPIFVEIENRHCLVVGGGEVAARKAGLLLKFRQGGTGGWVAWRQAMGSHGK